MAMWRQFTTWIGGVGIIVLFLAVLPRLRIGGRQALFRNEAAGPELGLADTIRDSARRFVVLYVAITALRDPRARAARLDRASTRAWTSSAPSAHAFATIATAGFSTEARSIEPFAPATQWAITFFMVVAGTNFALMFAAIARRSAAAVRARRGVPRLPRDARARVGDRRARAGHRGHLRRRGGGPPRRLQRRVDDDHDRLRQRGLQRSGRR